MTLSVQLPAAIDSSNVTAAGPPQTSSAVTCGGLGTASHSTVTLVGTPERTGAVVSTTVIICTEVFILPHSSVTTQVRSILSSQASLLTTLSILVHCKCAAFACNHRLSTVNRPRIGTLDDNVSGPNDRRLTDRNREDRQEVDPFHIRQQ